MPRSVNKARKNLSRFLQSPPSLRLAQVLPIRIFRSYVHLLGFTYYLAMRNERRETTSSIISRATNGSSRLRRYSLIYNTYRGIFDHYYEKLLIATRSPTEMAEYLFKHSQLDDTKWLNIVKVAGRGAILATGHIGASEFLPVLLALHGYDIAALVRYKTARLRQLARRRAEAFGILMMDTGEARFPLLKAARAVRDGKILIYFCDEFKDWVPLSTHQVSVLGDTYPMDKGLVVLNRVTEAPVAVAVLIRARKGDGIGYKFLLDPISEDSENPISYQAWETLKKYVNRYPEQWYKWNEVARELAQYRLKAR